MGFTQQRYQVFAHLDNLKLEHENLPAYEGRGSVTFCFTAQLEHHLDPAPASEIVFPYNITSQTCNDLPQP
jgi:hypothetical protein